MHYNRKKLIILSITIYVRRRSYEISSYVELINTTFESSRSYLSPSITKRLLKTEIIHVFPYDNWNNKFIVWSNCVNSTDNYRKMCLQFTSISNTLRPTIVQTKKRLIICLMKSLELFRSYKETLSINFTSIFSLKSWNFIEILYLTLSHVSHIMLHCFIN